MLVNPAGVDALGFVSKTLNKWMDLKRGWTGINNAFKINYAFLRWRRHCLCPSSLVSNPKWRLRNEGLLGISTRTSHQTSHQTTMSAHAQQKKSFESTVNQKYFIEKTSHSKVLKIVSSFNLQCGLLISIFIWATSVRARDYHVLPCLN